MHQAATRRSPRAIVTWLLLTLLAVHVSLGARPLAVDGGANARVIPDTTVPASSKPRVIGYLGNGPSGSERACMAELRRALNEAGWSFDSQLTLEWNDAGNDPSRLPGMAQDLVARRPDVLLTTEVAPADALMRATRELPIIVIGASNLRNVVDAQARPLANVTGVTLSLTGQHAIKPMEVLLQAFPGARRIGLVENSGNPLHQPGGSVEPIEGLVRQAGAELFRVRFSGERGISAAWEELARHKVDAVMIRPDSPALLAEHGRQSLRLRLPAISHHSWFSHRHGGLLSYGVIGRINMCARAARYIDRVLRGQSVREMPVEELFEAGLSVNLSTAESLGVKLPPALIARADRLYKQEAASRSGSMPGDGGQVGEDPTGAGLTGGRQGNAP